MRVGLISDVHANLVALEAVLPLLEDLDEIWVMGDTVGYGPDPSAVLERLRGDPRVRMVAGNHDRAVATGRGLRKFNRLAADAARLHQQWLRPDELHFLEDLPFIRTLDEFTTCHGNPLDPTWGYVFEPYEAEPSFRAVAGSWCCGHTHKRALFRHVDGRTIAEAVRSDVTYGIAGRVMVNPGSVGQPRDRDPRSSFAVLDLDARTVTFHRAAYDVVATQRRMATLGLPPALAERLAFGV